MILRLFFLLSLCVVITNTLAQPYSIGQITTTYVDSSRSNRNIPTEIFYPAVAIGVNQPIVSNNEAFPIIVFGHGFSMNYNAYQNFWEKLVPKGYIIIFPKTETATIPFPDHAALGADLSFLLDLFLAKGRDTSDMFFTRINDRSAVMGHSMGGGCSFLAAEANSNFTVISGFAPAETNVSAIAAAKNITIPALIFAGALDNVTPEADHNLAMYDSLASDCKTRVKVNGGSHCGFGIINTACDFGETTVCIGCNFISRADQHRVVFDLLLPWLNFYLKGDCPRWDEFNISIKTSNEISFQQQCSYQLPVTSIQAVGDTVFCQGDSVLLIAGGALDKQWSSGQVSDSIYLDQTGTYNFIVTDEWGCKDTSSSVQVQVNMPIMPEFVDGNYQRFCEAGSAVISLTKVFTQYQWSTGDTTATISVNRNDSVTIKTIDQNGCEGISDTLIVVEYPMPATPVITLSSDTLFATGNGQFQWYFNGSLVNGANKIFIKALTEGTYTVEYIDTNGCQSLISEEYLYQRDTISSVGSQIEQQPLLFPNPTTTHVYLKGVQVMPPDVLLFNSMGEEMPVRFSLNIGDGQKLFWGQIPSGLYYLRIEGETYKLMILN